MLLVLFCAGVVVYQTYRLLSPISEYLRCTVEGFYLPNRTIKKPSHFYAWADVEEFSFSRSEGSIGILSDWSLFKTRKCEIPILSNTAEEKDSPFYPSADLIIPIFLLDVGLPERSTRPRKALMEREWRIEQNRQGKKGKTLRKQIFQNRHIRPCLKYQSKRPYPLDRVIVCLFSFLDGRCFAKSHGDARYWCGRCLSSL